MDFSAGLAAINPVAAIGSGLTEAASAWYANRTAQERQREAFDQNKWMYQNKYQMTVKDLQAAGLNPMLAYTQGASTPASSAQAQTYKPDMVRAQNESIMTSAQSAKINQETENLKLEAKNIAAVQDKLNMEIARTGNEVMEIDQRIKTGRATEQETKNRAELVRRQEQLINMQISLAKQELAIKTPEEIASGTEGAVQAAHISRVLKPLIDAINGALKNIK